MQLGDNLIITNTDWIKLQDLLTSGSIESGTIYITNVGSWSVRLADVSAKPTNGNVGIILAPGVQVTYEKGAGDLYVIMADRPTTLSINSKG